MVRFMEPVVASPKLAIVIPCYRVTNRVAEVVRGLPPIVDLIEVVDDCCPQRSGEHLKMTVTDKMQAVLLDTMDKPSMSLHVLVDDRIPGNLRRP